MILAKLKEATRGQHDALESAVDVMNRAFTLEDYGELLLRFYRFYSAVEPRLPAAELMAEGFDIAPRRKVPRLRADLERLGLAGRAGELPEWMGGPEIPGTAEAFGSIYVMEGATLGGQVITRHLKQHLGITPEGGGSFFNSYGPAVGPMWKAFGAAITAFTEKHPGKEASIIGSARETFDGFRECFQQPLAEAAGVAGA